MQVRDATTSDGEACAAIYAPYVRDTAISFEAEPPAAAEMSARIEAALATHAWLVAEEADQLVGYAYGSQFRAREAYRRSCEVSVYLDRERRAQGVGRLLYTALLDRLAARGLHTAVAGYTLPNPGSERLHQSLGFEPVGVYRDIGFKFGTFHDVAWVQRQLDPAPDRQLRAPSGS
ncbi:MAG: N-acetyltransferase [Actinomycetales bacterium]|nr:N-acetyltransferase [Actinomycetales bacterium]